MFLARSLAKGGRKWVVVPFLLSFVVTSFLLSNKKASAEWSFDNTGPTITIAITCDINGRKAGETGTTYTCLGDSAVITVVCSDTVTGCKSTSYKLDGVAATPSTTTNVFTETRLRTSGDRLIEVTESKDKAGNNGNTPSATLIFATCSISSVNLADASIREDATTTATATVTGQGVSGVNFYSGSTAIAEVTSPDTSVPYTSTVTGIRAGSTEVTAKGIIGGVERCTNSSTITVITACTINSVDLGLTSIKEETTTTATAIMASGSLVNNVKFTASDTDPNQDMATVSPTSDSSSPYSTTVSGVNRGTSTITAKGYNSTGTERCSNTATITVIAACTIDSVDLGATSIKEETTTTATAIMASESLVNNVKFTASDTNIATVSPDTDSSSPYSTTVSGVNRGTSTITAKGYNSTGTERCSNTATMTVIPGCGFSSFIPNPTNVIRAESGIVIATLNSGDTVNRVDFSSSDTNKMSVAGSGGSYNASISGLDYGSVTITATGVINNRNLCTTSLIATVIAPGPWWQVKDMDVMVGSFKSEIPAYCTVAHSCTPAFNLPGSGLFPGVTVYGSGTPLLGSNGTISSPAWLVNTSYFGKKYDYAWFKQVAPPEVFTVNNQAAIGSPTLGGGSLASGGYNPSGVIWKSREGNLTIDGGPADIGSNKVVLFVNGDLTINSNINLTDGLGFFAAIVSGNILIDSTLTQSGTGFALEGLYVANGRIRTRPGTSKLRVRGSFVGWDGIMLERDLGNSNDANPAEYFEYAPDLIFTLPPEISRRGVVQKEVAP